MPILKTAWNKLTRLTFANLITAILLWLVGACTAASVLVYHLESRAPQANIKTLQDGIWWSVVTALTVGYGDRYPVTPAGRLIGGVLMLMGVLAVAVLTSKISSYFLARVLREGRGIVETDQLHDHVIICGWKEEMDKLIDHVLEMNRGLKPSQVVLVANLNDHLAESLRENPGLKGLNILIGEYYQDSTLRRAAPERARKVLILADRTPNAQGQLATPTEVDARTIMTAMTLSNIARGTLVAAEVIDAKMDHYLKLASVSEIIYTRECSRLLLGNAAAGTGLSNILYDLLDPKTPTHIMTAPIPEMLLRCRYEDLKSAYETEHPDCTVVGVLENTGNQHRIKENALRQAQKTPDVARLVQNLRAVKEIRCNHPVFNPAPDYEIQEGSLAIVIETRRPRPAERVA